jgi:hypothetical protein
MQDTELFLSLAEIAGVFIGFGALIAVRGAGTGDAWGVAGVGLVVWGGIEVVALALVPVAVGRFEVADHALWVSCSLFFLALFWVVGEVVDRVFPERMAMRSAWPLKARWRLELVMGLLVLLPMHILLVLILLGVLPDREAALYFAALVLLLLMVMFELLWMVISGGRPQGAEGDVPDRI